MRYVYYFTLYFHALAIYKKLKDRIDFEYVYRDEEIFLTIASINSHVTTQLSSD